MTCSAPSRCRVNRRDSLRASVWLAPRAYSTLAIAAVLCAAGSAVAPLWWAGIAVAAGFAAALAIDLLSGPRLSDVDVERLPLELFSLLRAERIAYRVRNRASGRVAVALIEAPTPLLRFDVDECSGIAAPHDETLIERPVTPVARGSDGLTAIFISITGSIGLVRRRQKRRAIAPIRVYPDLSAVARYGSLHARNRFIEAGLRRMRLRGGGTQPESAREWNAGDPFRSIDWKATARRGKIMVAQYEVERSQNIMIVLDAGRLMTPRVNDRRKFDYAVTAALSVASVASLANDKVGVVAFAAEIFRAFAPRASGRSPERVAQAIHDLEPRFEQSDYDRAFAYVRTHVRKRSLIVFFTDMVDPVSQSSVLSQIATLCRQHLVVCAFMNDAAIDTALETRAETAAQVYAAGVALELRDERRAAAATLTRLGVHVIDVPAHDLTVALLDQYLRIKQRGEL